MDKPIVAKRGAIVTKLDAGTYWWCACGRSKEQPFCDGSHKGTTLIPVKIEVKTKERMALCGCKHSQKGYVCDGSHKKLPRSS